jgi:hypothetical protein
MVQNKIIRNTAEEDELITKAAMLDPDCPPLTEEEWHEIKHRAIRGKGRPLAPISKTELKNS